jgi:hypothetical protein
MKLPLSVTRFAGASGLFWKKNGATVLTGVGVAGVPAAMILTAIATVKFCDALPDIKKHISEAESTARVEGNDEKTIKKEVAKAQLRMAGQCVKVYSPAIAVGTVSVACLIASHGMMKKREAQLAGAFVALEAAFKAYRQRVAEKIGADEEVKLYRGAKVSFTEDGDGESCVIDWDATQPSIYAKYFDESSSAWSANPEYNLTFLRAQQNSANDRLRARGHLFLNEVYEMLGFAPTQAGQVAGWLADANEKGTGDGFVDFGIYQIHDPNNRAFVNGYEHTVGLDFNCDGVIIKDI